MSKKIIVDPDILGGKPIIKGTRISVELILKLISSGMTIDEILKDYPHLTRGDIFAAVEYAAQAIRHEKIIPHAELVKDTK